MKDSVRLGRIAGIGVGLNWSLLVVVGLLAGGLADSRFPVDAPGYTTGAYATAGALTALALLLAVLLHELAHAVVARRAGLAVDGITLSWMGGVTRIEGESRRPAVELAVASAGPVVSVALGGALWLGRFAAEAAGNSRLAVAALGWLAVINVVLAIFNLLPAAPLDGGRVLHALVWAVAKDRSRATKVSSGAGVGLGALIAGFGLWELLTNRDLMDGLFLGLIGWWIVGSARQEAQGAVIHDVLDGLAVYDVMRPVGAAPGWITLRAFAEGYAAGRPGWVWLLERWGGGYEAVLAGDALARVPPLQWDLLRPIDIAIPLSAVAGAEPTESLLEVLARTTGHQAILVVHDDRTVGAILPSDIEALIRSGARPHGAWGFAARPAGPAGPAGPYPGGPGRAGGPRA